MKWQSKCSEDHLRIKNDAKTCNSFWTFLIFLVVNNSFWTLSKTYLTFWQKLLRRVVKTAFYVSNTICVFFFGKLFIKMFIVFGQGAKSFWVLSKFSRQGSRSSTLRVYCSPVKTFFLRKLWNFFLVFGHAVKFFWLLSKFSRQGRQSCILLLQKNMHGSNWILINMMFSDQLRTLSKNISKFWEKIFNRVVKMAFYVRIGALRRENFYLKILWIFIIIFGHWVRNFGFLSNNSWRGCQSCSLRIHSNILRRNFCFWGKWSFITFLSLFSEKFRLLVEKASADYEDLNSTCLLESWEKKIFLDKILEIPWLFRTLSVFFRFLSKCFRRGWPNCNRCVPNKWKTKNILRSFLHFYYFYTLSAQFLGLLGKNFL